jgi:hypothetical protein
VLLGRLLFLYHEAFCALALPSTLGTDEPYVFHCVGLGVATRATVDAPLVHPQRRTECVDAPAPRGDKDTPRFVREVPPDSDLFRLNGRRAETEPASPSIGTIGVGIRELAIAIGSEHFNTPAVVGGSEVAQKGTTQPLGSVHSFVCCDHHSWPNILFYAATFFSGIISGGHRPNQGAASPFPGVGPR